MHSTFPDIRWSAAGCFLPQWLDRVLPPPAALLRVSGIQLQAMGHGPRPVPAPCLTSSVPFTHRQLRPARGGGASYPAMRTEGDTGRPSVGGLCSSLSLYGVP
ncbi:hypothetical protein BDP55DRAFT_654105 [Colletotrichum godetiae]|uniref:Uncharacterized protein n=1 Tax=Colletotrichum godetiae TaxID=1209918 RepID=A0AAJ0ASZ6_9PEZI|nr:uncharacterized protein BDP55DRAFT_654105 [Colletotrichum godetiae]KAK1689072.1 hypothetical protein BDP55DRAFT_654105 [Colletotrichum godetiae]